MPLPGVKYEDNIKIDIKKLNGRAWAKFMWLRIGPDSWLL
jgi:hypothetical protein